MEFSHISVLKNETIENLCIRPDGIYVDGTMGGAGHSLEIGKRLNHEGHLIGIDQDEAAIQAGEERLAALSCKVDIVRSNYCNIKAVLDGLGVKKVDGIMLDLGVSSYQLDTAQRGFSYWEEAPLDMRMDQRNPLTAKLVVNEYSESELFHIIKNYGEDSFAKNIAKHIVMKRQEKKIETTTELAEIIKGAIPMKVRKMQGHPAKKTFQAIRIEVNRELTVLEDTIDIMIDLLNDGGRLCIITFHSLEDRIVKQLFRKAQDPCTCPKNFPMCVCGKQSKGKVITRKPILPTEEEIEQNARSRSAKLRVFEAKSIV